MKRYLALFICIIFSALIIGIAIIPDTVDGNTDTGTECIVEKIDTEVKTTSNAEITVEQKIAEAVEKINAIDTTDKKEWFVQYRAIQAEYAEWLDPDETIYDYFSLNDIYLLLQIVEAEVQGEDNFIEKANVASVIYNRIEHEDFPVTLVDVLTEYPQFSSYTSGAYSRVTVTDTTVLACEYAFQIEDTTSGALYFDSTHGNSWADSNREYLFTDGVGHSFYR